MLKEFFNVNLSVAERASQSETVNLIMVRENDYSSIRVFHLYVTAFSVYVDKPESRESPSHLFA